jgi:hypothetical protein
MRDFAARGSHRQRITNSDPPPPLLGLFQLSWARGRPGPILYHVGSMFTTFSPCSQRRQNLLSSPSLRNRAWSGSTVLQYWSTYMRLRSLNSCTFKGTISQDGHFSKSLLNCLRIFWISAFGCTIFYSPIVRIFEGKLFRCQKLKFIAFVAFPNAVKQSLHSIRWGFYKWNMKDDDQKILLRICKSILNVFTAHLPILVRCKIKGAVGAVCAFTAHDGCLPITVGDGAVTLKGRHRMGDGRIFLKTFAPLSLINTYRMCLISLESSFNTRNFIHAPV